MTKREIDALKQQDDPVSRARRHIERARSESYAPGAAADADAASSLLKKSSASC